MCIKDICPAKLINGKHKNINECTICSRRIFFISSKKNRKQMMEEERSIKTARFNRVFGEEYISEDNIYLGSSLSPIWKGWSSVPIYDDEGNDYDSI